MVVFLPVQCVGGHLAYLPGLCSKKKNACRAEKFQLAEKRKKIEMGD